MTSLPFNISLGTPPLREPLVKLALDILSIDGKRHNIDKMSSILLSPYLGAGEKEHHAMAQLDAWFRERNALHIGLTDILQKLEKSTGDDVSHFTTFAKKVGAWRDHLKVARKKNPAEPVGEGVQ